ncbi:hypothetical protein [Ottowia sp.]|jgi:hypothetical protein|uniref:hypothetical protein n=1 Tax=Ottowia sp. TaxID=1898956 RepID=UPI002627027A|nr:hypothetical protein [Ottowia sp.]
MSLQPYSVLNVFASPRGHFAEISRVLFGSPATGATEWVWIEDRHVVTLQQLDGHGAGAFQEGLLHMGDQDGEMRWVNGRVERLVRVGELPAAMRSFLELHLF